MTVLDRSRRTASRYLTDRCEILRPSDDEPVLDRDTGRLVDPAPTTLYADVACSGQTGRGRGVNEGSEGGAGVSVVDYLVRLPHTVIGVRKGDIIRFTVTENADLAAADLVVEAPDLRSRRVTTMLPCNHRHHENALPYPGA